MVSSMFQGKQLLAAAAFWPGPVAFLAENSSKPSFSGVEFKGLTFL